MAGVCFEGTGKAIEFEHEEVGTKLAFKADYIVHLPVLRKLAESLPAS
jgi:hypothetical protein